MLVEAVVAAIQGLVLQEQVELVVVEMEHPQDQHKQELQIAVVVVVAQVIQTKLVVLLVVQESLSFAGHTIRNI
jgi:hypothetical protein